MTYGFIITRHVNSKITNNYWNECVYSVSYTHLTLPTILRV